MKIQRGWLLSKDPDTNKNIPFFVKVRDKDIVVTNAPNFEDVFTKLSSNATCKLISQTPEASTYEVIQPYNSSNTSFEKYYYKVYNDGNYVITTFLPTSTSYGLFRKNTDDGKAVKIIFPYSIQNSEMSYGDNDIATFIPDVSVKPFYPTYFNSNSKYDKSHIYVDNSIDYNVEVSYEVISSKNSLPQDAGGDDRNRDYNNIIGHDYKVYSGINIKFISETCPVQANTIYDYIVNTSISDMLMNKFGYNIEIKGRYK